MFKKFTALLLITAFTNVYAITPIQQSSSELGRSFDSLNYKLNVEWDQKDSRFFDASITEFEKEIAGLQKDGMTNSDLIAYTAGKIKDKQFQNEINELSKVISETQMSDEEARAFVVSKLGSTYAEGASWTGRRLGLRPAFIIGAIIIILIITTSHHRDEGRTPNDGCYDNGCDNYPTDYSNGYTNYSNNCCPN